MYLAGPGRHSVALFSSVLLLFVLLYVSFFFSSFQHRLPTNQVFSQSYIRANQVRIDRPEFQGLHPHLSLESSSAVHCECAVRVLRAAALILIRHDWAGADVLLSPTSRILRQLLYYRVIRHVRMHGNVG